jgi:methylenetetrahydrofolate reductase (NADPH)
MRISDILKSKKLTLSFEVFPPKKDFALEPVLNTVGELAALKPDWMSVTYGAGGGTRERTAEIAASINKTGVAALAHFTCVGKGADYSRADIEAQIAALKEKGIENILALRGDLGPELHTISGFEHASDLVPLLRAAGFCVGGACYPEGHPEAPNRDTDLDNLKRKVDAGAEFLTTQMFFDNDMLYSFLYRAASRGIHVPVIAGIMPITNASQVEKMIRLSNAYIPRKLLAITDRFEHNKEAMFQAGIIYAVDQIIDLVSNGISGIHIYTMNKAATAQAIVGQLDKVIGAANQ